MKNLYNIITRSLIVTLFVACTFSCADLEEEPRNLLAPETFFKSSRDVQTAVFGIHGVLQSGNLYGGNFLKFLLLRGDMTTAGITRAERIATDDFTLNSSNGGGRVQLTYTQFYKVVAAANNAISGAETVGIGDPKVLELLAEARFLRAFAYYHLVRVYGGVTILDGLPDDPLTIENLGRNTEEEVYSFILEDLQFAKDELPDLPEGGVRGRPTKATAAAFLASVYLTRSNYANAYTEAKFVIDNANAFGLGLDSDFSNLFKSDKAAELVEPLLTFDFESGIPSGFDGTNQDFYANYIGTWAMPVAGKTGWSAVIPSQAVFDAWDDGDYRKEVSFSTEGIAPVSRLVPGPNGVIDTEVPGGTTVDESTPLSGDDIFYAAGDTVPYTDWGPVWGSLLTGRPHAAKYVINCDSDFGDCRNSKNNYIAMRYAEVLLIAAEAAVMGGGGSEAEAIGYINQIRARARGGVDGTESRTSPADFTGSLTQADVIEERRLELAFEWKRWYDIKRLEIGPQVFGSSGLDPHPNFDPAVHYLWPFDQFVLQANNSIEQNPGY